MEKTVIIANRRRGSDYWEGYIERAEADAGSWADYYRRIGHAVKVFPDINEYRADCNRLLDSKAARKPCPG